ncbi:MAG: late control D family protein, partial [Nitratireductor sp.]|nr:late control D family protein [Nitratireductor sp.]
GADFSSKLAPYLLDISVTDKAGAVSDSASISIDNTDGHAGVPQEGAPLVIFLEGAPVFNGVIDSVRCSGSRSGGRKIAINGKGFDPRSKAKEPQQLHQDDSSLQSFLGKVADSAGFSLSIKGDLGSIERDYWAADGESLIHVGQRLARELNATFKLQGNKAVLAPRDEPAGLSVVAGIVGREQAGNVIDWDIAPYTGRPKFAQARVQWFDRKTAETKEEKVETPIEGGGEASNLVRSRAMDAEQAQRIGKGRGGENRREGGDGSVTLDLTVTAKAEGIFTLTGADAGADGIYRIESVTHSANRSGGSITKLELKQPE